jgi:hypothetical protein
MNINLAENFSAANAWQQMQRDRYLIHFYQKYSLNGRYVFIDKSACSTLLQKQLAVDTIFQSARNGASLCIEEKIDSGTARINFALETDSCTVKGREKPGWMHYAQADYLLYAFVRAEGGLKVYLIDFAKLREWFWQVYEQYRYYVMPNTINHTGIRLVPIRDVEQNVPTWKYICTDEGCIPVKSGSEAGVV